MSVLFVFVMKFFYSFISAAMGAAAPGYSVILSMLQTR